MNLLLYLLKINIAMILFYCIYYILMKRDTFFHVKRFLFLIMYISAVIYPFCSMPDILFNSVSEETKEIGQKIVNLPEIVIGDQSAVIHQNNSPQLFYWIYWSGFAFLFSYLLSQLLSVSKIICQSRFFENRNGLKIRILKNLKSPFSFFNQIIIDPDMHTENELKEIILHEETHARQWHSLDIIFSQLMCAVCWFNPFMWLLKKEIGINLEFLADNAVVSSGYKTQDYQLNLLRISRHKIVNNLSNNFNISNLKTRIHMMNKKKTSKNGIFKYTLIIPLVAVLLFINDITIQSTESTLNYVVENVTNSIIEQKTDIGPEKIKTQELKKEEHQETEIQKENPPKEEPQKKEENKAIFMHVEKMPQYQGGEKAMMTYLAQNIKYPVLAQEQGIQGIVVCRFVVSKTGKVEDVAVTRSLDPTCDQEAIRVISNMPQWIPGEQKGEPVDVYYTLPIRFKLSGDDVKKSNTELPPNVIIELDGKQISSEEFKKLDSSKIKSLNIEEAGKVVIKLK